MVWRERRSSDRHVIELPIKYRVVNDIKRRQTTFPTCRAKNICDGGLLFLSTERFSNGTLLELTFPVKDQIFTMKGTVVHVRRDAQSEFYKIGIQFPKADHVFKVKMAEQLRQIDQYQQMLSKQEGRIVPEEEAAHRWIETNSGNFAEFFKEPS